jgi:uncharacterized protein YqhQ
MPVVCIVMVRRFWIEPAWQAWRWWTVAIIILLFVAIAVLRVGPTMPPAAPNALNEWSGLIQRMILIPFMLWLFTVAYHMRTLA